MAKLGIISDIHSNVEALKRVFDYFKKHPVDKILCAGDIIGYYTRPAEVITLLKKNKVTSIKGNHEMWLLFNLTNNFNIYARQGISYSKRNLSAKDKLFLRKLPITHKSTFHNKKIIMVHGSPVNPLEEYIYPEDITDTFLHNYFKDIPDILIMGNTHIPFIKKVNQTLIINPGSVGQPRDGDSRTSFAIYDSKDNSAKIIRLPYDIKKVAKETSEYLSTKLAERLYRGE